MKIKNFTLNHIFWFLTAFVFTQEMSAAPVYKSKDSEGNVTYSIQPPEDSTQVKEVKVPKNSPANESSGDSVKEIEQKADALAKDNRAREKEIKQKQNDNSTPAVVVEEEPVTAPRPIIQNRPNTKPPAGGGPPVARPLPSGGK